MAVDEFLRRLDERKILSHRRTRQCHQTRPPLLLGTVYFGGGVGIMLLSYFNALSSFSLTLHVKFLIMLFDSED